MPNGENTFSSGLFLPFGGEKYLQASVYIHESLVLAHRYIYNLYIILQSAEGNRIKILPLMPLIMMVMMMTVIKGSCIPDDDV